MNRSVVTHHNTAWCRSHRATSRCTAGSVLRRYVGRGGKRVASATLSRVAALVPLFQPDQKTIGQHHGHGMPMKSRPQAALVLVPAQLPLGLFMELLDGMAPVGIPGQLCQCGLRRQVAPMVLGPPGANTRKFTVSQSYFLIKGLQRPRMTITHAYSVQKDGGTSILAYGPKPHNPLFFRVQWSLLMEDLFMTFLACRKFFPNCAWRANYRLLEVVLRHAEDAWRYWLSRRSQKGQITGNKLEWWREHFPLPTPKIVHNI
jgi:hypothetical protein